MISSLHATNPKPDDKWMIAELWQDVFHVSYEYLELFFNRIYNPENTFVIKRDQFIISALHVIPFDVKLNSKTIPCAYIYGAGTHPFERGCGHMRTLLNDVLMTLKERGYYAAFLIPAEPSLFNFYRLAGFDKYIYCRYETLDFCKPVSDGFEANHHYSFEPCTIAHFPYFDRKQHEQRCIVLHRAYDYETIIQDLALDGGGAYVALENNNPVGMAFVKKISNDAIFIKSILSDTPKIYTALYRYANTLLNAHRLKIQIPLIGDKYVNRRQPYGLACILVNQKLRIRYADISLMLD